jgi:hypothetical protein
MEDCVAWRFDKKWFFMVRSAYHTQIGNKLEMDRWARQCKSESSMGGLWKSKLPAKIKIFCWKFLHGILPYMGAFANIIVPAHLALNPVKILGTLCLM